MGQLQPCLLPALAARKAFRPQLAATLRCLPCSLIFLSELGDKTFFIAALLAMRCGKWISFIGSTAALAAMTVRDVYVYKSCSLRSGRQASQQLDASGLGVQQVGVSKGRVGMRKPQHVPAGRSLSLQIISVGIGFAVKRVPTVVSCAAVLPCWWCLLKCSSH